MSSVDPTSGAVSEARKGPGRSVAMTNPHLDGGGGRRGASEASNLFWNSRRIFTGPLVFSCLSRLTAPAIRVSVNLRSWIMSIDHGHSPEGIHPDGNPEEREERLDVAEGRR
jgi:hypothetical protein